MDIANNTGNVRWICSLDTTAFFKLVLPAFAENIRRIQQLIGVRIASMMKEEDRLRPKHVQADLVKWRVHCIEHNDNFQEKVISIVSPVHGRPKWDKSVSPNQSDRIQGFLWKQGLFDVLMDEEKESLFRVVSEEYVKQNNNNNH